MFGRIKKIPQKQNKNVLKTVHPYYNNNKYYSLSTHRLSRIHSTVSLLER